MAIEFNQLFGGNKSGNVGSTQGTKDDRPKAQFWLNIGYQVEVPTEEGTDTKFVSLPVGIPLDTQEALPIRGNNESFIQLRSAQNDLLKVLQDAANAMEPGQSEIVNLQIELRRVNGERVAVESASNPFTMKQPIIG